MDIQRILLDSIERIESLKIACASAGAEMRKVLKEITGADKSAQEGPGIISPESHQRTDRLDLLTPKEREIFDLLGIGLSTKEIASRLDRSQKTIEAHRETMRKKLGHSSSHALVEEARKYV